MKGFTLVEMLIILGVIGLLTAFVVPSLLGSRISINLDSDAKIMAGAIREAQSRSITGEGQNQQGQWWGICFYTTPQSYYELRKYDLVSLGSPPIPNPPCDPIGQGTMVSRYNMSTGISINGFSNVVSGVTSAINSSPLSIIFSRGSGVTTVMTMSPTAVISGDAVVVNLRSSLGGSRTVTITSNGTVQY